MKKKLITLAFVVTFFLFGAVEASAVENDMVKVGLRYGSSALFSANLENAIGEGYAFGWFDEAREFHAIGETEEIAISMTAAGTIYMNGDGTYSADKPSGSYDVIWPWHIQVEGFETFEDAQDFAWEYDGYVAYVDDTYMVRIGCFESKAEGREALEALEFVQPEAPPEEPEETPPEEPEETPPEEPEEVPPEEPEETAPVETPEEPEQQPAEEQPAPAEETPLEGEEGQMAPEETDAPEAEVPAEVESAAVAAYSRGYLEELDFSVVRSSDTGVLVTVTRSDEVIFEFDCLGDVDFGVMPLEERRGEGTATWFKGYKYPGGFSYTRSGSSLNVINVVGLEEYVQGVIPYEMSGSWPVEALKAQAVCARTYVCASTKHLNAYGFDICNTTCCQVYYGRGSGAAYPSETSDEAVWETAGECIYYQGDLIQNAVYHSADGGATEDVYYVWGSDRGYLKGKEDPYESQTSIPRYSYSVTYTASELTEILKQKGYKVGTVQNVYVSEYTPRGNVYKVTFEGSKGNLTVKGDTCRTIFYSSTYNKSVRSLRYTINGVGSGKTTYYVNGGEDTLTTLKDVCVLTGSGEATLGGSEVTILTSGGKEVLAGSGSSTTTYKKGTFTIDGTGSGHNVGMSQYGAKAMAELGFDYDEILHFYFTDVKIR